MGWETQASAWYVLRWWSLQAMDAATLGAVFWKLGNLPLYEMYVYIVYTVYIYSVYIYIHVK